MKPSRYLPLLASAIAVAIPVASSQAQVIVNSAGSPQVITFDSNFAGVVSTGTKLGTESLAEPNSYPVTPANPADRQNVLITTGASIRAQFSNSGNPFAFGADANNNTTTNNVVFYKNVVGIYRPTDTGTTPSSGWAASAVGDLTQLTSNAFALNQAGTFQNGGLYLRIQNNTGAAVSQWSFGSDVFYADDNTNYSTFTWGFSATNSTNVAAMTFTSLGATPAISNTDTLADAKSLSAMNVVTPSVANGDYIVLRFLSSGGNDGSTIFLDNISIAAVPEPGTWALLGLGILAIVIKRRRRLA